MKVLFLSQIVPYPPHGGVLQRGYNLLRELGRRAEVHLLAFVHPDELPTAESREESRRALEEFCARVEFFPLWAKASLAHKALAIAAGACSRRPFSTIAHRSVAFQRCVSQALTTSTFDLVHVDTIALAPFVDAHPDVPRALTHHNIESRLLERRAGVERRWAARRFLLRESAKLARYEAAASLRFDVNIMMSAEDAALLRTMVPGVRAAVVPNGVDITYFRPSPNPESAALIYTGGMNMFANRDAVLYFAGEIWPQIAARVPEATFFAVGQDPPPELRALCARDSRIVITGKVPDVRPFVERAAVYVVPLRVGGGTRLKVLDAMAAGKALVSTSIGCEGLAVTPGREVLIADTPVRFAEATVQLLGDSARREALGRAARRLAEARYAWPIVGDALMAAYRDAVSGRTDTRSAPVVRHA